MLDPARGLPVCTLCRDPDGWNLKPSSDLPAHLPYQRRTGVRCGLDYQCFLRKDSPLNLNLMLDFKAGPRMEGTQLACHPVNVPLYLAVPRTGQPFGQWLEIKDLNCAAHQPVPQSGLPPTQPPWYWASVWIPSTSP